MVRKGDVLGTEPLVVPKTSDIVQGLPRIERLFEARARGEREAWARLPGVLPPLFRGFEGGSENAEGSLFRGFAGRGKDRRQFGGPIPEKGHARVVGLSGVWGSGNGHQHHD